MCSVGSCRTNGGFIYCGSCYRLMSQSPLKLTGKDRDQQMQVREKEIDRDNYERYGNTYEGGL